jgi:hypothetical protein
MKPQKYNVVYTENYISNLYTSKKYLNNLDLFSFKKSQIKSSGVFKNMNLKRGAL